MDPTKLAGLTSTVTGIQIHWSQSTQNTASLKSEHLKGENVFNDARYKKLDLSVKRYENHRKSKSSRAYFIPWKRLQVFVGSTTHLDSFIGLIPG